MKFNEQFEVCVRARELWKNLAEVFQLGIPLQYEVCDIRWPNWSRRSSRACAPRMRIDGVVYGAMLEHSKSVLDKVPSQIAATLEVKATGLIHLLESTRDDDLKLLMCFGSGAGRFGNKGQSDYCGANDLMSKLVMAYAHHARPTMRCVTIDWTAWDSVGAARNIDMVAATGVSFISPSEGSYWFVNELLLGHEEREVAIFDESMFHRWPFLGSDAEGPGERRVVDDRGRLLVLATTRSSMEFE